MTVRGVDTSRAVDVVGAITVNGCCTFRWREPEGGGRRIVDVRPRHCERCIAELRRSHETFQLVDHRRR